MATGDIRNNLERLAHELRKIKCNLDVDSERVSLGDPSAVLPIINYIFMEYSRTFAKYLESKGHRLFNRNDLRFIEAVYKVLRDEFAYRPVLQQNQFFSDGFAERKILFVCDIIRMVKRKHEELTKRPASATSGTRSRSTKRSLKDTKSDSLDEDVRSRVQVVRAQAPPIHTAAAEPRSHAHHAPRRPPSAPASPPRNSLQESRRIVAERSPPRPSAHGSPAPLPRSERPPVPLARPAMPRDDVADPTLVEGEDDARGGYRVPSSQIRRSVMDLEVMLRERDSECAVLRSQLSEVQAQLLLVQNSVRFLQSHVSGGPLPAAAIAMPTTATTSTHGPAHSHGVHGSPQVHMHASERGHGHSAHHAAASSSSGSPVRRLTPPQHGEAGSERRGVRRDLTAEYQSGDGEHGRTPERAEVSPAGSKSSTPPERAREERPRAPEPAPLPAESSLTALTERFMKRFNTTQELIDSTQQPRALAV